MRKNFAKFGVCWLGSVAVASLLVAACSGSSMSLGDPAGGSAGTGGSMASAGAQAGGSSAGGSSSTGAAGSSQTTCDTKECGPQLGLLNEICADGSMGGPTGRCLKRANGSCGWEIRECPPDNGGTGGDASTGGTGTGGAPGGACGGKTCTVDQICCGPAECGFCVSKLSGIACPNACPNGDGGASGAPDCTQLRDDVTKTQADAQACNPASAKPTAECAGSLEGVCCPIGVESASPTAPANAAYLAALKAYKTNCAQPCPAIACFEPKVGDCKPISAGSAKCSP
jgi:hypothetical protein